MIAKDGRTIVARPATLAMVPKRLEELQPPSFGAQARVDVSAAKVGKQWMIVESSRPDDHDKRPEVLVVPIPTTWTRGMIAGDDPGLERRAELRREWHRIAATVSDVDPAALGDVRANC